MTAATVPVIILLIILEALYIFISLKAISREKLSALRNVFLFLGIVAANLGSAAFTSSPFRFLLASILIFGIACLVCNGVKYYRNLIRIAIKHGFRAMLKARNGKVCYYTLFLVMAILTAKVALEIGGMMLLIRGHIELATQSLTIFAAGILTFPVATFRATATLAAFVDNQWHKERTFWVRYALAGVMMLMLFLIIYAMTLYANSKMLQNVVNIL